MDHLPQNSLVPSQPNDTSWAMGAHLSGPITSLVLGPFGPIVAPLVIWLVKRDASEFVAAHAKEALNANISYFLYCLPLSLLGFLLFLTVILIPVAVLIGIVLLILWVIWIIRATIAAGEGRFYPYPLNLRLIK